jgi:NAD(P)-dependent dehydrogenase (short-subunit alcohol dehydrogenase family)
MASDTPPRRLPNLIAAVAGATRGAGRGIARALGAEGATVLCTGRSVRGRPSDLGRPETVDETAELVTKAGGRGIAMRVDHTSEADVAAWAARIEADFGRLDLLVNDVWGGDDLTEWGRPFWELDLAKGRTILERAVWSHILTSRHALPLLRRSRRGLVVEVTDGATSGYRMTFFYDLAKAAAMRMAYGLAVELAFAEPEEGAAPVTAVAITPGFLRSEAMLERFGVTEANWRDAIARDPHFAESETPSFVGRAVAALAADPNVREKNGAALSSFGLAREYGFVDEDGRRPDWGAYFARACRALVDRGEATEDERALLRARYFQVHRERGHEDEAAMLRPVVFGARGSGAL